MQHFITIAAAFAVIGHASPVPQGVTARLPAAGSMPPGCKASAEGAFGIVALPLEPEHAALPQPHGPLRPVPKGGNALEARHIVELNARAAPSGPRPMAVYCGNAGPVTIIADGQPQAPPSTILAGPCNAVTVMSPVPVPTLPANVTGAALLTPVSIIGDGQPQAPPTAPLVTPLGNATVASLVSPMILSTGPGALVTPVTVIADGQPQAPVCQGCLPAAAITVIADGQPQAPLPVAPPNGTASFVTVIADGQPQAPMPAPAPNTTAPRMVRRDDTSSNTFFACKQKGTLQLKLQDGLLHDQQDRQGYIASNFQFQFDQPPQAGSLITSGFAFCNDQALALGSSKTFYRCRSGDFFNLYDRNQAAQCEPVMLRALELKDC